MCFFFFTLYFTSYFAQYFLISLADITYFFIVMRQILGFEAQGDLKTLAPGE